MLRRCCPIVTALCLSAACAAHERAPEPMPSHVRPRRSLRDRLLPSANRRCLARLAKIPTKHGPGVAGRVVAALRPLLRLGRRRAARTTFARAPALTGVRFYYGELLYSLGRMREAAEQYDQVWPVRSFRHAREAAHGAAIAWRKISGYSVRPVGYARKQRAKVDGAHLRLLAALTGYIRLAPAGKAFAARQVRARLLYDLGRYAEAARALALVLKQRLDKAQAAAATTLSVYCMLRLRRFSAAQKQIARLANPTQSEPLRRELRRAIASKRPRP